MRSVQATSCRTIAEHLNLQKSPGLGVQIHTTAKTDDEAKLLLTAMRFPFRPS